jgi:chromosome segregation ATPase
MSAIYSKTIFNFYYLALAASYAKDITAIAVNSIFKKNTPKFTEQLIYKSCSNVMVCANRLDNLTNAAISIMGISIFVFGYLYYENIKNENKKFKSVHGELKKLKEKFKDLSFKIDQKNAELEILKEQIQKVVELASKSRIYLDEHNEITSTNKAKKVAILEIDSFQYQKLQEKFEQIKKASKGDPQIEHQKKIRQVRLREVTLEDLLKKEQARNAALVEHNQRLSKELHALKKRLEKPVFEDRDFEAYQEFLAKFCEKNNINFIQSQTLKTKVKMTIDQFQEMKREIEKLKDEKKILQQKIDATPKIEVKDKVSIATQKKLDEK